MTLEQFLQQVEKKAFRMAQLATGNVEDALDIVQDAMFSLVKRYALRQPDEWPPLFYRIMQNRIMDWHRRKKIRQLFTGWLKPGMEEATDEVFADQAARDPVQSLGDERFAGDLQKALQSLPVRQQQTFLLRCWEGLDVKQTAAAMGISHGSVKTHYSRAVQALRDQLSEHGEVIDE